MSLLGKVFSAAKGALGGMILGGGSVGAAMGAAQAVLGGGKGGGMLPPIMGRGLPSMPGGGGLRRIGTIAIRGGKMAAKVAAGAATAKYVYDAFGNPIRRVTRRKKGISGSELRAFKRIARLLHDYQATAKKHHVTAPTRRCR